MTFINGYDPALGDQVTVVTGSPISGAFASFDLPALTGDRYVRVLVNSSTVRLRTQRPGDADGNGVVNVVDMLLVLGQWGGCAPGCDGDVFPIPAGNGVVTINDFLMVLANWG